MQLVVDPQLYGSNRKVSNLINMLPYAHHELLVMADSDAFVGRDYLVPVTAPLRDSAVGLVTCLYRGVPTPGIWSRLGAMYINEWYIPSVLLTWLFGYEGLCLGPNAVHAPFVPCVRSADCMCWWISSPRTTGWVSWCAD